MISLEIDRPNRPFVVGKTVDDEYGFPIATCIISPDNKSDYPAILAEKARYNFPLIESVFLNHGFGIPSEMTVGDMLMNLFSMYCDALDRNHLNLEEFQQRNLFGEFLHLIDAPDPVKGRLGEYQQEVTVSVPPKYKMQSDKILSFEVVRNDAVYQADLYIPLLDEAGIPLIARKIAAVPKSMRRPGDAAVKSVAFLRSRDFLNDQNGLSEFAESILSFNLQENNSGNQTREIIWN